MLTFHPKAMLRQAFLSFPAGLNQHSHKSVSWKQQIKLPCANTYCWMPRVWEREDGKAPSLHLSIPSIPCTHLLRKTGKHSLRAWQEPCWHKSNVPREPALALTTGWSLFSRMLGEFGVVSVNSNHPSLTTNILHLCLCQQISNDFSNLELLLLFPRSVLLCQKNSHTPT